MTGQITPLFRKTLVGVYSNRNLITRNDELYIILNSNFFLLKTFLVHAPTRPSDRRPCQQVCYLNQAARYR